MKVGQVFIKMTGDVGKIPGIFFKILLHFHTDYTRIKFHTRTILYEETVKLSYLDIRENFQKN